MEDGTLRRLMLIDVSTDAGVADEIYIHDTIDWMRI